MNLEAVNCRQDYLTLLSLKLRISQKSDIKAFEMCIGTRMRACLTWWKVRLGESDESAKAKNPIEKANPR